MGLPRLDVDLDFPAEMEGHTPAKAILGVDISGSDFTTALSITGKGVIQYLLVQVGNSTTNNFDVQLEIDGEIIWDTTLAVSNTTFYFIGTTGTVGEPYQFNSSFILRLRQPNYTTAAIRYIARPIK